jgi:hypothetical protein
MHGHMKLKYELWDFGFEVIYYSDGDSSLLRCLTVCNSSELPIRLGMFDPEDGGIRFLRHVSTYLPDDTT